MLLLNINNLMKRDPCVIQEQAIIVFSASFELLYMHPYRLNYLEMSAAIKLFLERLEYVSR